MKIPETSANVGAYYGNEENGQWQPNGVIIDSGVGGGVVGSGDAGIHRPPVYPVHLPRGHMPGYVMAGAYYPPAAYPPVPAPPQDDFADYMWMENEEEFDKQVMQQLEEEALMEQCIEAMLEDEQRERQQRPTSNGHNNHCPTTSNGTPSLSLEETVSRSTLNPLAAEFVPTRARPSTEESPESTEAPTTTEESTKSEDTPPEHSTDDKVEDDTKTEEPVQPHKDPPEVSAADIIADNSKQKDIKKESLKIKVDAKKSKTEVKSKVKPAPVRSDTKVQIKKKDIKSVKSESKVDDKSNDDTDVTKQISAPSEDTSPGFKPINYAAAAKANKPKKPSPSPPITEKTQPKIEKKEAKIPVQRKNSAK